MSLSKISDKCKKCELFDECDKKRMEKCAYLIPEPILASAMSEASMPVATDVIIPHDYREIKISDSQTMVIDVEEFKDRMQKEIYKSLYCDLLQNGS